MLRLINLEERNSPASIMSVNNTVIINQTTSFQAFEDAFPFSANTALVDGQYAAVAPEEGGGPRVQVYTDQASNGTDNWVKTQDFFAFESDFRGGVNVAFADVNSDNKLDLIVSASHGGGPRVQIYLNTPTGFVKNEDFFAFDPNDRSGVRVSGFGNVFVASTDTSIKVYQDGQVHASRDFDNQSIMYGSILNQSPLIYAEGPTLADGTATLTSFDLSLQQINTVNLFTSFTNISLGGYVQANSLLLMGTKGDGSFVELDESLGIPLSYDTFRRPYNDSNTLVGNAQEPLSTTLQPPDLTGLKTLSSYRDGIFDGISIGSQEGTGTLTAVVNKNGQDYLLTNRHVVESLTFDTVLGSPMFSPGPADTDQPLQQIGTIAYKSDPEVDNVDAALILPTIPVQANTLDITYLDPYTNQFHTELRSIKYDPSITLNFGDIVYDEGRTSGFTRGTVFFTDETVDVEYQDGVDRTLQHQIVIIGEGFAQPGDSGSKTIKFVNGQAYWVAQLFAGSPGNGIATPASMVLNTIGATFNQ